ncbi:MAG: glycosyl hydrolase family 28-related protein [Armatimonadota bacterium]
MSTRSQQTLVPVTTVTLLAASLAVVERAHAADDAMVINVRSLGAKGDGKADDTAAFENAVAAGREKRLPVHVPLGTYRLTRTIRLQQQALTGQIAGGWPSDSMPLPRLLVDHTDGPALQMGSGSSIHGIAFLYSMDRNVQRGPTLLLAGQGLSITNLRIQYPYDAIKCAPRKEIGRTNIENVFIVSPTNEGVQMTMSHDITTLRNIEVWCNVGMSKGPAFRFGKNDEISCSNLFAFNAQIGYLFKEDEGEHGGGTYGTFTNCATDACSLGYVIDGWANINIVGGDLINHFQSLEVRHPGASVSLTGARVQSNGAPGLLIRRCRSLLVTGCRFGRAFENPDAFMADIGACDSVSIVGCHFDPRGKGIRLSDRVKRAVVVGNIFEPSAFARIVSEMPQTAPAQIGNNVE